jgi:hypothetical protein
MSEPISLVERRWNTTDDPKAHRPSDMLRLAADKIDRGEIADVEHVIILIGSASPKGELSKRLRYMQAGRYDHFGQLGLIHSCAHLLDS